MKLDQLSICETFFESDNFPYRPQNIPQRIFPISKSMFKGSVTRFIFEPSIFVQLMGTSAIS